MPKRKVTIWVDDKVAGKLEKLAEVEKLTLSQFGARLIERGVTEWADTMGWDVVGVRVEDAVKREVGRMSDRLAQLLVRSVLESTATRVLIYNERMQSAKNDEQREGVKQANSQAWTYAVDRLKTPVQAVKELLGQV